RSSTPSRRMRRGAAWRRPGAWPRCSACGGDCTSRSQSAKRMQPSYPDSQRGRHMLLRKISQAAVLFILFIGSVALAQATPPPPATEPPVTETPAPPTPTSAPPTPAEKPPLQEEVVVTGSRIRRKDLTTPAP